MTRPADTAVESKSEPKGKFASKWRQAAKAFKGGSKGPGQDGFALSDDVMGFLKPSTDAAAKLDAIKAATLATNLAKVRDPTRVKKSVVFSGGPADLIGEGGEMCDDPTEAIVPRSKRSAGDELGATLSQTYDRSSRLTASDGEPSTTELMIKMRAEEGVVLRQSRTPRPDELDDLRKQILRAEEEEQRRKDGPANTLSPTDPNEKTPIDFSPSHMTPRRGEPPLNPHKKAHSLAVTPTTPTPLTENRFSVEDNRTYSLPPQDKQRSVPVPQQPPSLPRSQPPMKSSPPPRVEDEHPPWPSSVQAPVLAPPIPPKQLITSAPEPPPPIPLKTQAFQTAPTSSLPTQLMTQQPAQGQVQSQYQHQSLPSLTQQPTRAQAQPQYQHRSQPSQTQQPNRTQQSMPQPSYQLPPTSRPSQERMNSSNQSLPSSQNSSSRFTPQQWSHPPQSGQNSTQDVYPQQQRNQAQSHSEWDNQSFMSGTSDSIGIPTSSRHVGQGHTPKEIDDDRSYTPSSAPHLGASLASAAAAGIASLRVTGPTKMTNPMTNLNLPDRQTDPTPSNGGSAYPSPYPSSMSIKSPASLPHSLRPSPALDDFTSRVSHMWRIFSLTAGRDGPLDRLSARQWLRGGVWWFVCARAFFEAVARKRGLASSQGEPPEADKITQQLLQGHVDLAKAVWVVDIVLPDKRKERDSEGRPIPFSDSVQVQADALRKQIEALTQSMGRHNLLPPHEVLIQGLDQLVWVRYPQNINPSLVLPNSSSERPEGMISLTHATSSSETVFEPLAVIPLADSPSRFCLFRSIGRANLVNPTSGELIGPMPVVVSVVRPRGRLRLTLLVAGQIEGISVVGDGSDLTWGSGASPQKSGKPNPILMRLRTPSGILEITLQESESSVLRVMYDSFMRAVNPMVATLPSALLPRTGVPNWPEELLWEGSVAVKVNYFPLFSTSSPPDTSPPKPPFSFTPGSHKSVKFAVVALANRAGLRLCLVDGDAKAIQVLVLNALNPFPIRVELTDKGVKISVFQNPPASTNPSQSPGSVASIPTTSSLTWLVRLSLVLASSQPPRELIDVLGGAAQSRPRDSVIQSIELESFHIEPFFNRLGDSAPTRNRESADEIPCNGAITVEEVSNSGPSRNNQPNGLVIAAETGIRLSMIHHSLHMRVTLSDRISDLVRFRLPSYTDPKPEIELLRFGKGDLSAIIERPEEPSICPDPAAAAEPEWRSVLAKSCAPSIRLYRCASMDDLHLLQSALTGWLVKYDGRPRSVTFPRYSTINYPNQSGTERSRRPTISLRPFQQQDKDKGMAGSAPAKKAPVISFSTVGPNRVQIRFQLLQHRENPERYIGVAFLARSDDGDGFGAVPPAWVVFSFRTASGMSGAVPGISGMVEIGDPTTFAVTGKKGWLHKGKEKGDKDDGVAASPSPHLAFSLSGSAPGPSLIRLRDVCVKAPGSLGTLNVNLQPGQVGVSTAAGSVPHSPIAGGATPYGIRNRESEDKMRNSMNGSVVSLPTNGSNLGPGSDRMSLSTPDPGMIGSSPNLSAGFGSGDTPVPFSTAMLGGAVVSGKESDMFTTFDDGPASGVPIPGTPAGTVADVLIGFDNPLDRKKLLDVLPL